MSEQNEISRFFCYDRECGGLTTFYPKDYSQFTTLYELEQVDNSRDVIIKCNKCDKPNLVKIKLFTDPYQQGQQIKPGWEHD